MIDEDKIESEPPAWPRVIKLAYPVDFGSERITSLTFRRGRAGDVKGMKLSAEVPVNDLLVIASRLSGQPREVIELLDVEDAGEVMDVALDFFTKFLTAGKTRLR